VIKNKNLINILFQNAHVSGRSLHKEYGRDRTAIIHALDVGFQSDFICPICDKIIDITRTVLISRHGYKPNDPQSLSMDRIDCDKGYIGTNVRCTHRNCNTRRGERDIGFKFSNPNWNPDEETIRLIKISNTQVKNNGYIVNQSNIVTSPELIIDSDPIKTFMNTITEYQQYLKLQEELAILNQKFGPLIKAVAAASEAVKPFGYESIHEVFEAMGSTKSSPTDKTKRPRSKNMSAFVRIQIRDARNSGKSNKEIREEGVLDENNVRVFPSESQVNTVIEMINKGTPF
jgi:hypothetical protein